MIYTVTFGSCTPLSLLTIPQPSSVPLHWTDLVRNLILLMSLNCTNEPSLTYWRSSNGNNCNSISFRAGHSLWLLCPTKNSGKLIQERKHNTIQTDRTSNQSKLSSLKSEGEVHVIQKMKYFNIDSVLSLSFFRMSHQNYEVQAHISKQVSPLHNAKHWAPLGEPNTTELHSVFCIILQVAKASNFSIMYLAF